MSVGGVPLVGRSVMTGCATPEIESMYCSSDSKEILKTSRKYGAITPFIRPKELATDSSPELLSWKHFARYLISAGCGGEDIIVSLPPTAPLRKVADVQKVIEELRQGPAELVITYFEASVNPSFTTITIDGFGNVSRLNKGESKQIFRRQDASTAFHITPVAYAATVDYVIGTEDLFGGTIRGVEVPRERAADIDSEMDIRIANFLFDGGSDATNAN